MTEKQKLRIIKYQSKCQEFGYEFIEHFRRNRQTMIKCKCFQCDFINDYQSFALMKGQINCSNCLIIKYQVKCQESGYEYIEHFRRNKNTIIKCKCFQCNFIKDYYSNNLIKGHIMCSNCLIIKYQEKCEENGYEYIEHFCKNKQSRIKCKCNKCNLINDFGGSVLMTNSVKCKCEKKTFVRGYIYKLTIGSYYYIGLTDTTINTRYSCHKKDCFYEKDLTKYNSKVYKTIREELCRITGKSISEIKENFNKYVLVKQVAIINTSRKDLKLLESQLINLNNCWCLNSML